MNRQAFSDLEAITVRVEERRLGPPRHGNWRVYEFTGFDAIPPVLRPAFSHDGDARNASVPLLERIIDLYRQRRRNSSFEAPYEIPSDQGANIRVSVSRTITITLGYRGAGRPLAEAA